MRNLYKSPEAQALNLRIMEEIVEERVLDKGVYRVYDMDFLYLAGDYALEIDTDGVFPLPVKALRLLGDFVQDIHSFRRGALI